MSSYKMKINKFNLLIAFWLLLIIHYVTKDEMESFSPFLLTSILNLVWTPHTYELIILLRTTVIYI